MSACKRQPTTNERTQQRPRLRRCATASNALGGAPARDVPRRAASSEAPRHGNSQRRVCRHARTHYDITRLTSVPPHHVQPTPMTSHPHPTLEIHAHSTLLLWSPSSSMRQHGEFWFRDAIGGRSTSTKGVRTVETRRVRREAGRRGVRTILDDVLLAPRRRLHRRSSRQPLPSRLRPGRRHHDLQTRLDCVVCAATRLRGRTPPSIVCTSPRWQVSSIALALSSTTSSTPASTTPKRRGQRFSTPRRVSRGAGCAPCFDAAGRVPGA